jgi:hypothetical protein
MGHAVNRYVSPAYRCHFVFRRFGCGIPNPNRFFSFAGPIEKKRLAVKVKNPASLGLSVTDIEPPKNFMSLNGVLFSACAAAIKEVTKTSVAAILNLFIPGPFNQLFNFCQAAPS